MHPTYSRVLSHENSDDSDTGRARALRLPQEGELAPLVPQARCEDSNVEGI
jgi:hypothetical protein